MLFRFFMCLSIFACQLDACTGITLKAKDGSVIYARTLEFGVGELDFGLVMIPRNTKFTGLTPDGKPGKKWTSKYGVMGANIEGTPYVIDGQNEKGLAVGLFYFPGYAKYAPYTPKDANVTIAEYELGTWLLSRFATVQEAIDHLHQVDVVAVELKQLGIAPPVHYIVHDASGDCAVIEYTDEGLKVYDNPIGVFTNSPEFSWQTTNLGNYINLSAEDAKPVDLSGDKFDGFGMGSGLFGVPGDYTPPSRFVRATALSKTALPVDTGPEAVKLSFHILDSFDISIGTVRLQSDGKTLYDHTQFTSSNDLNNHKFYFTTYDSRNVRMLDFDQFDLDKPGILLGTMDQKEVITDLSDNLKPM